MAFLAGIKVKSLVRERSEVTISYGYLTKNPFRSIYFACLSMAAELSAGVLSMMAIYDAKPIISMLVADVKAEFTKKAVGTITFTCSDGEKIFEAVKTAKETGEGVTVVAESIGIDEKGDTVATFYFTWTFRQKRK